MPSYLEVIRQLKQKKENERAELQLRWGAYMDKVLNLDMSTLSIEDAVRLGAERDQLLADIARNAEPIDILPKTPKT